jgi:hypothetical protein
VTTVGLVARVERPGFVWLGIGLQVFIALAAIPVGLAMIADANGSPLGIPHDWIAGTPFGSFLLPGVFLLLMNGAGQLIAAGLAAYRHWLSPWLMGALGVGLMVWIAVQVVWIPLSFLQPFCFVVGTLEGFVALFWLRRLGRLGAS